MTAEVTETSATAYLQTAGGLDDQREFDVDILLPLPG
jgi:hypothetical protein